MAGVGGLSAPPLPHAQEAAASAAPSRSSERVSICGIGIDTDDFEGVVTRVIDHIHSDPEELARMASAVELAGPRLFFFGLGAPRQEKWIDRYHRGFRCPWGSGSASNSSRALVPRAPRSMQRWGLEWLHRFFSEPRRLWRRYLPGNAVFVWMVTKQRLGWASHRRVGEGSPS